MTSPADERCGLLLLAAALATGLLLMIPAFQQPGLLLDEHVSYWIAGSENPGGLLERSFHYAATPPLSSAVQRAMVSVFGRSAAVLRTPSVIAFLAAIVGIFLFARRMAGPFAGGLAAVILALYPETVDWMRVARPYGLSVGLAAWSLYFTARWSALPNRLGTGVAWSLVNVALVWTHYLNVPLVALEAVILLRFPGLRMGGHRQRPRWIWLVLTGVMLAIAPLSVPLARMWEWAPFLNYREAPPPLYEMIGPMWWAGLPAGCLTALLIARVLPKRGAHSRVRSDDGASADCAGADWQVFSLPLKVLIFWGAAPLLILVIAAITVSPALGEERYRLVYAPAGAALSAVVLARFRIRPVVVCGVASMLAAGWWLSGSLPWRSSLQADPAVADWRSLAHELQEHGRADEPIFVSSGLIEARLVPAYFADPMFMDYVACRMGRFYVTTDHPRQALPWFWAPSPELLRHYRTSLEAAGGRSAVWVAGGTDTDLGRQVLDGFRGFLRQQGYEEAGRWTEPTAVLIRYEPVEPGEDDR